MKKISFIEGTKMLAGGIFLAIAMTACNNADENSSTDNKKEVATDTTTTTAVTTKKKGKASYSKSTENANLKVEKDKDGIYTKAEVMPQYPGNDQALANYISDNIVYPEQAIDNNVEGTVNVQFVVDENGKVSDVTTIGNKLGYGLEEEAMNVVNRLPAWTPGKVKGKNVKTKLTVPITYKLES